MTSPNELKEGFDLVVDCSGSGPAMEAAVPLLSRGGRLCVFGVASPKAKLTIEPFQVITDSRPCVSSFFKYLNHDFKNRLLKRYVETRTPF